MDSVVLLHVLWRLQAALPIRVQAVHVHHGLQAAADDWAVFCRRMCADWAIPLRCEQVQVTDEGAGPEATARQARYAAFARSHADALVLAHHADDQVETLMLAALRGGGLRALAAMPARRRLPDGVLLWRPLLPFSRRQLAAYAQHFGLAYVQDPSNQNMHLLRNWLRAEGLPAWRARVPHMDVHLTTTVAILQDELAVLEECAAADWQQVSCGHGLDVAVWRGLSPARQRQQLRRFALHYGLGQPGRAGLAAFAAQLNRQDGTGGTWSLPQGQAVWQGATLWPAQRDPSQQWPWLAGLPQAEGSPSAGWPLCWQPHALGLLEADRRGLWRPVCKEDVLPLRVGRKNVKKMLQERHIPPFMRNIWPVLAVEAGSNQCLAVANVAVDAMIGQPGGGLPVLPDLPILA